MSTKKELTPPRGRDIYCNRTLNLGSIKAVGYDMDYTLIQYHVEPWERMAFDYLKERLKARHWPVSALRFDPKMVIRGLVIDTHMGNILKANRFGYVKRTFHGTRPLDLKEQRKLYSRTAADAFGDRFVFKHTLFSLSLTSMYMQLVKMLDEGKLPGVMGYEDLYHTASSEIDIAHLEGKRRPRSRRGLDAAGSEGCGKEAAPHHELGLDLHEEHDVLRPGSVSPGGSDLA
jgi:5'-nucleotidase